jgi:calcineurin-like phosphoesterase
MGKLMDVAGNKAMEIMGKTARQGIDNFMKAFSKDYEIEYIIADLELKPLHSKGTLQIKMKKKERRSKS